MIGTYRSGRTPEKLVLEASIRATLLCCPDCGEELRAFVMEKITEHNEKQHVPG